MIRPPAAEDLRLWAVVTATVRPLRPAPKPPPAPPVEAAAPTPTKAAKVRHAARPKPAPEAAPTPPAEIEPGRRRRLTSGRDGVAGRIDLHGYGQDAARSALTGFLLGAAAEGWRAVLVITGKGSGGDGVLRRRVPEWLAAPPLRALVAGVSPAHRRHGGEGALYVALRRPH